MQYSISVITCAHNSRADYLDRTLGALKNQTLEKRNWEFLLIDNASDKPLHERIDLSWHPHGRHVREERLGLTHARLRGISEAKGEILVFVDDDNVLSEDFLEQVAHLSTKYQMIGAWSGQCKPVFDVPPPQWTKRYWGSLALREFDQDQWSNLYNEPRSMPNGAGLCVRKSVADHYAGLHSSGQRNFLLDRSGQSLVSGGDIDLAACACDIGFGVGVFASLKLHHLMPPSRLSEDYLLRLIEGIAYSEVILDSFRVKPKAETQRKWSSRCADLLRFLRMDRRQRRFYRAYRRGQGRGWHDLLNNGGSGIGKR